MMKKIFTGATMTALLLVSALAWAHAPQCACSDNGDGTITCQGGFSNGASAAGVKMSVADASGKIVAEGKMNQDSEFSFKKPDGAYVVKFEAGRGHGLEVKSSAIGK
ncbi:hypothetical protein SAMN04488503_1862 [Humidesulfovibrio mexicanus]|uniref:Carboxypeptidase regulatory-like domain-containing protein n=1 Tax=Humidesulfovibrio mexicanus TaxID=147047 RepID=A0A239A6C7_9BACT|nr:hypothetical protein SAMN04488503_1862 [Humidesulfovibrio mexicanus]